MAMTKRRLIFIVTTVLLLLSLVRATYGHHGINAWFDMTKSATVKGAVTGFDWTNPHAYIHIDVKNDKGAVENWTAEMGSVGMLARAGWRKDTVKMSDEITLIGKPAKDGKPMMILDKVVMADGRELPASDIQPGTPVGPPRADKVQ